MQRGLDNTLWDIQCHRCVQNAVRNPAERKQLYLRWRTERVKQRGVMFRPAFENHVVPCRNSPSKDKNGRTSQEEKKRMNKGIEA